MVDSKEKVNLSKPTSSLNLVWGTNGQLSRIANFTHSRARSGIVQKRSQEKEIWPNPSVVPLSVHNVDFDKVEQYSSGFQYTIPKWDGGLKSSAKIVGKQGALLAHPTVVNLASSTLHSITTAQRDRASAQALSRVGGRNRPELGVFLAELGETISLLRNPLKSLSNLVAKYRRVVRSRYDAGIKKYRVSHIPLEARRRRYFEAAAGSWLTYRYGVRPLLMEIDNVARQASDLSLRFHDRCYSARGADVIVYSYANQQTSEAMYNDQPWETYPVWLNVLRMRQEITKCSYVVRYKYRPEMADAAVLASWGLSPTQVASIIYEATPFSFMLDWAVNLGTWIRAVEPKPHVEVVDIIRTDKWSDIYVLNSVGASYRYGISNNVSRVDGVGYSIRTKMSRRKETNSFTAPKPQIQRSGETLLQELDVASIFSTSIIRNLGYGRKKL